jgi:hypothetical protein
MRCEFLDGLCGPSLLLLSSFWRTLLPKRWPETTASGTTHLLIRQWFQGLRQPDNPRVSCCGEADAYEADLFEIDEDRYVAIITDGKGEIPNGTKIPVPNHKMKWDEGNPTGHGIIFIGSQGQVFCYIAPGGV